MAPISYTAMIKTDESKANSSAKAKACEMNLRLPGQVYDAETGLNQNYYRDYDAQLGRYTTPDPMEVEGGMNPYSYVSNNPLTNIDPLGLYEEGIHYYMSYFLARAVGVDARRAYIIATAAQYVDDNPITRPTSPDLVDALREIVFHNAKQQNRLSKYHFTQSPGDDDPALPEATRYMMNTKPENAQLQRLNQASDTASTLGSDCAGGCHVRRIPARL